MFYRRKIFLALVEAFGGTLKRTDFQKLHFLFCKNTGRNYYDFFPYKYGSFSQISYQDKRRLTDLGFLVSHEDVRLNSTESFLDQIKPSDRTALTDFATEIGNLRGNKLVRRAYLEFPHYASRSEIAKKILDTAEYENVSQNWTVEQKPCLFTIGYEGLSIDAYLDILVSNNITSLVDVRKNPISRKQGFSKTRLSEYAASAGLTYYHIPELGVASSYRKELHTTEDYKNLFDYYATEVLPIQRQSLEIVKFILHKDKRIAITCYEANPNFCHRHILVERIQQDPDFTTPVIHCRLTESSQTHGLT